MVRLTSPDGFNWTPDAQPVVVPEAGTYYGCVAAHPYIVFDNDTDTLHMWFKSEQSTDLCTVLEPDPEWGCNYRSGIGYASSDDFGQTWTFSDAPALDAADMNYDSRYLASGYPSVVIMDDVWYLLVSRIDSLSFNADLILAESYDFGDSWTVNTTPALAAGFESDWVNDEVISPSMFCDPDGVDFSMFFGGRTLDETPSDSSDPNNEINGVGFAASFELSQWYLSLYSPYFDWEVATESYWPHFTVLRAGGEYIIYHTERIQEGTDTQPYAHMRMAYTDPAWDPDLIDPRICNTPIVIPPDTDVPDTDTDVVDTDTDVLDTDTDIVDTDTDIVDTDTDVVDTDTDVVDTDTDVVDTDTDVVDTDTDVDTDTGVVETDTDAVVETDTDVVDTDDTGPTQQPSAAGGGGGCCKRKPDAQGAWILLPFLPLVLRRRRDSK